MKALTFPKSVRLLKPADYGKVFDDVQLKVPHRNFLILAAPNNLGHARVGLIFSKKNLRHAVQRNRIKRQVRETFRLQQDLPSLDIIVLGRQGLNKLENPDVRSALNDIWRRVKKKYHQVASTQPDANAQGNE
ncbi:MULTISPECIES: ribonuclease P protein component [unclassified Marinobacter]|uniref:ribonuclease P protein component n=1 Tax=unclassified Marinobacter TaxID=83889 RepID=UPI00273BAD48|nr:MULTISPECIES: ribonuclease P protein component [unclassified Marinobacter]MDP4547864.1 ribonuclease P protein component [Marinobacter sp. MDS2]